MRAKLALVAIRFASIGFAISATWSEGGYGAR
jgi:hypothetical protein